MPKNIYHKRLVMYACITDMLKYYSYVYNETIYNKVTIKTNTRIVYLAIVYTFFFMVKVIMQF